ncbi:MAG: MFS transporter, partial [Muribaculaceae bacterium]|nr:MFS transporter [Muribaculaceae bacterium]
VMGLSVSLYSFSLPRASKGCENSQTGKLAQPLTSSLRMMFGKKEISIFLVFVIFSGVCLQISNGFATPFITHFIGFKEYAESFASGNATMLFSLSQIAEAASVLLVGIALSRMGMKCVYAIGLFAWSLRFFFLGFGNPADGLWLLIGSMLVYGIAFNFITIAGHIYIQQNAPANMKGFAQGLMMFMSNGIGATFGTIGAGAIVNRWCHWEIVKLPGSEITTRLFMGDWQHVWIIFALYALIVMLFWLICFRKVKETDKA